MSKKIDTLAKSIEINIPITMILNKINIYKSIFLIFLTSLFYHNTQAQSYTRELILPMDIPIFLSANFGELRPNHYHTGIDIKTQSIIGLNVFSIDDGYVSRIKVGPKGYGKTIFITHPNGIISVYAHLEAFSKSIDQLTQEYQYEQKLNIVDFSIEKNKLTVKKGEIIAKAGNSGSSQGPHLHFEIRDAYSERALNPLQFYPQITDNVAPKIFYVKLYPLDSLSTINGKNSPLISKAVLKGQNAYTINQKIIVSGNIGVGIQGDDYFPDVHHTFGFYSIDLYLDDSLIYAHKLDKVDFGESKNINNFIDYDHYTKTKKHIQKSYISTFNKLGIYQSQVLDGKIHAYNEGNHHLTFEVKDFAQNKATLNLDITYSKSNENKNSSSNLSSYFDTRKIQCDGCALVIPKGNFYDAENITCRKITANSPYLLSDIYSFSNQSIAIKGAAKLSLPIDSIDKNLLSKIQIVSVRNKQINKYIGGIINNNYITAYITNFSNYSIGIDTIKPNIINRTTLKGERIYTNEIKFFISDNESGILCYNAYIDGNWTIVDYDAKYNLAKVYLDNEKIKSNTNHTISFLVTDNSGNTEEFTDTFFW
ncbi:MAG: M23 family metallopeptidase [Bacteroidales bacterium]|nr:M23 family metallopeptidase [Bacteroidales bacterium]